VQTSHFFWGAATAAFQIEGATKTDGRTPSIWDTFSHLPGKISTGDTADIACDHYHRLESDLDVMQSLGINSYRFSVSWTRILPDDSGVVNAAGIDFYNRLIDGLLKRGITPFLTMYHWDLPQYLHNKGGWNSRESVDWFAQYSQVLVDNFGDRVKHWITINEPHVIAWFGYYRGWFAPGIQDLQTSLNVAHHLLMSHGRATQLIHQSYPEAKVGISCGLTPVYALTDSPEDRAAAAFMDAYDIRWFLDPIYGKGYPREALERFGINPPIHEGDLDIISTQSDFLGVNFYLKQTVKADSTSDFFGVSGVDTPGTPVTGMGWEINPEALTDVLLRVTNDYPVKEIFITENGSAWDDTVVNGVVEDIQRIDYLSQHLDAMQVAIAKGAPVNGYFAWSLFDNFEWTHGFAKRFGLVYIDYQSQERIVKQSGVWYKAHISNDGF
jgi:beta-glucosidase